MYQSFDALEYVQYLRRRWRVVSLACGVAILVVLPLSLIIPKRYTATATIVIEPPGASDSRPAIVVSQTYLESLKTYERFADSDSLFTRAAAKFHLQEGGSAPIESLKRTVLKVTKLRDTTIMEISVTLKDPKLAQCVAEYLANETVALSRAQSLGEDRDFIEAAEKQAEAARLHLAEVERQWASLSVKEPMDSLQGELDAAVDLQAKLRTELVSAEANMAEYQAQEGKGDSQFAREQLRAEQARKELMEKRLQQMGRSVDELAVSMARRSAVRDALQNERTVAQTTFENAEKHLDGLRATAGSRGDRLRVMDPGIVPERPSSPNVVLNVAAGLLFALVASVMYLSFAFVLRERWALNWR